MNVRRATKSGAPNAQPMPPSSGSLPIAGTVFLIVRYDCPCAPTGAHLALTSPRCCMHGWCRAGVLGLSGRGSGGSSSPLAPRHCGRRHRCSNKGQDDCTNHQSAAAAAVGTAVVAAAAATVITMVAAIAHRPCCRRSGSGISTLRTSRTIRIGTGLASAQRRRGLWRWAEGVGQTVEALGVAAHDQLHAVAA